MKSKYVVVTSYNCCPNCGGRRWRLYRSTGIGRTATFIPCIPVDTLVDPGHLVVDRAVAADGYVLDECVRCGIGLA